MKPNGIPWRVEHKRPSAT